MLVEQEAPGGQASYSASIENYPGFPKGLSGSDFARRAVEQALRRRRDDPRLRALGDRPLRHADHGVTADRMGVIGFDLGGSVAVMVAAERTLGAAITVGGGGVHTPAGRLDKLIDVAGGITCPWLGLYGEPDGSDGSAEEGDIDRLRKAAAASEVATDVIVYPRTGHRFDDDPDHAADAWQRTLNWFDSHLR